MRIEIGKLYHGTLIDNSVVKVTGTREEKYGPQVDYVIRAPLYKYDKLCSLPYLDFVTMYQPAVKD